MRTVVKIGALLLFLLGISCQEKADTSKSKNSDKDYREISRKASAEPIHPGIPDSIPFWNKFSKRFIYAPAFEFKVVDQAASYRYELVSLSDSQRWDFESDHPYDALSPIWENLPVGSYQLKVLGISDTGKVLEEAGTREFYRAAPFDGIYHKPVMPYDSSATLALKKLIDTDFVQYWIKNKQPDPDYGWYRYPAKIYSALIIGAVTQARLTKNSLEKEEATQLATTVADSLISLSFPKGAPLEFFPPTYHGYPQYFEDQDSHMEYDRSMIIQAADAGHAYLDLYDLTNETKYLEAAKRIADTYLKTQMDNGSWYLYVNNKTGKNLDPNVAIPTAMINYFDRLSTDYQISGLEEATQKAFQYIMDNPVKTYNWQGQFEDISARQDFENQSREQACDLAIYLLRNDAENKESLQLAENLIRFAEDQFVIWERPKPITDPGHTAGYYPQNWITPSVQEQYAYWRPISRAAGIMIVTYWEAYKVTGKDIYLAKAKSIANAFTVVQQYHDGNFVTHFTKYKMNFWLNNAVYPAKVLMNFQKNIAALESSTE
jgi:maltose/maltodextrin transport system substrate-binding protein